MLHKVIFWHFGKNRVNLSFLLRFLKLLIFFKNFIFGVNLNNFYVILTIFWGIFHIFFKISRVFEILIFLKFFSFWIIFVVILRIPGQFLPLLILKRVKNKSATNMEILNQTFEKNSLPIVSYRGDCALPDSPP